MKFTIRVIHIDNLRTPIGGENACSKLWDDPETKFTPVANPHIKIRILMRLGFILDYKYVFAIFSILAKSLEKKYLYCRGLISFINKMGDHGAGFAMIW